jgi:hypothetical protein
MSQRDDLPRLPPHSLELELGIISDLKPGDQTVLSTILDIEADEAGHLWVRMSGRVRCLPAVAGLTLRAELAESGFILWLDNKVKFTPTKRAVRTGYLPVIEFREGREE